MKLTTRVIIGDPSFTSYSGHCYEYMLSVKKSFLSRGYNTVMLGNRGLNPELAEQSQSLPIFTYWCDARPVPSGINPQSEIGRNFTRRAHERSILNDLMEADSKIGFCKNDIFILNTIRHWGLRGVLNWMEKLGEERAPYIVLILHFTAFPIIGDDDGTYKMYEEAFASIEKSALRNHFIMMADSVGLINEYNRISNLSFLLAPIPHTKREGTHSVPLKQESALTLAYLGEARYHKGFHLLPYMVNNIQKSYLADRVQFRIQNFCNNPTDPFYRRSMGKFLKNTNLTFFSKMFDELEYGDFLNQADIVLIPYLLDNYYIQTSGIYAESISLGKPVVVSRGTWMASQVKQHGGGRLFPPGDPQGFLDACEDVIKNFKQIKFESVQASKIWNLFHNPEKFADIILEAIFEVKL